jgi:hypothetical protein
MWQEFLRVFSVTMPLREPFHSKGMSKRMEGRPSLAGDSADSRTAQQPAKHQVLRTVIQPLAHAIREKYVHLFCA